VQVLRRNPHLTADDKELLDIMQSGANRLSEIVGQFAVFRRTRPTQLSAVSLHAVIEETLARLRQDERCGAEIVIERRFDPIIELVNADAEGLRRALWELCLNGAQAIGKQGKLEVVTQRADEKILVTIRDSGPGIEASLAANIFAPLFTTKTRAAGLGLAIVKLIVEQHGGTVEAKSEPGKGASFTIALPNEPHLTDRPKSQNRTHARSKHGR
jgi:signal transduction histidine kinase